MSALNSPTLKHGSGSPEVLPLQVSHLPLLPLPVQPGPPIENVELRL